MRLLAVEDHPELGPDLKAGLEDCQYAVDLVTSGEDALALASLVPYDLLILDILLPDLDGWEVCRRLREILSRTTIAEHMWDYDADHFSNVIDVYIRNLRAACS